MTAKAQKAAADANRERWMLAQAEARLLETRRRFAITERNAYAYKAWAELRWPEPFSLGKQRMQMICDEMDGK
jgi:hypothetical protein